jgi:RsiW-degrading membrane proteinase PrsW (M82 family)
MWIFFLTLVPVTIYCFIIWFSMPIGSIDIAKCLKWFVAGCVSVSFLLWFRWLFPEWFIPGGIGFFSDRTEDNLFWLSLGQIGLIEESAKGLAFLLVNRNGKEHPITIMVGMGMVGLGFAFVENISYAKDMGESVIWVRSFTAMPFHLVIGLIWGWWISSGGIKDWSGRSRLGIWARRNPFGKSFLWGLCGMILVVFLHGLYDFNLFMKSPSSTTLMFMQILLCLWVAYLGATDLVKKSRKSIF